MRILLLVAATLSASVFAGRRVRPGDYLGLDHPAGELRLTLAADGFFTLRLAIWDAVVGAVAGHREMSGRWRRTSRGVELTSSSRRIDYEVRADGTLAWRRSSLPTFADGISLLVIEMS